MKHTYAHAVQRRAGRAPHGARELKPYGGLKIADCHVAPPTGRVN